MALKKQTIAYTKAFRLTLFLQSIKRQNIDRKHYAREYIYPDVGRNRPIEQLRYSQMFALFKTFF